MTWFKSFSSCVNELYVTFRFWATRHRQTDRQGDVHNGPPRGGHHNKRMTTTGCCDCWTFAYRKTWTPTSDSSAQREVLSSSTGKSFSVTYFLHSSLGVDIVPSLLTVIIELVKHDSWPIQPDILSPPLLRLTSRKPLWLDLQPVDIKSWRRHNWKLAQVVNSHLVCDPTIRQPGFDLPWQQWFLLNHFRTEQGHCGACRRKWWLTDTYLVLVARPKRCPTLLNLVPWQNWMVAYHGYTLRMKTLFRGWPIMVNDMHTRRRRLYSSTVRP